MRQGPTRTTNRTFLILPHVVKTLARGMPLSSDALQRRSPHVRARRRYAPDFFLTAGQRHAQISSGPTQNDPFLNTPTSLPLRDRTWSSHPCRLPEAAGSHSHRYRSSSSLHHHTQRLNRVLEEPRDGSQPLDRPFDLARAEMEKDASTEEDSRSRGATLAWSRLPPTTNARPLAASCKDRGSR